MAHRLTRDEVVEFWDRYAAGETAAMLARRFRQAPASTNQRIMLAGGCRPTIPIRARQHLSFDDREEISRGLAARHTAVAQDARVRDAHDGCAELHDGAIDRRVELLGIRRVGDEGQARTGQ